MPRQNGGLIGKRNITSFGKNTQTVHTSSGTKTFQPATRSIKTLIVAGGASGGSDQGGGGGAGGLRIIDSINLTTNSAPITIGAGGTAKASGNNSSVVGICGTILSTGGGAQLTSGGSGGGQYAASGSAGTGNAGGFSPPEGNNGGTGAIIPGCSQASGGGGGSGAVGGNSGGTSNAKSGGAGGAGTDTSPHFPGAPNCGVYAGGGGGGAGGPGTSGGAADSGGGSAGTTCSTGGNNATANTGGGAGGSGNPPAPSAGNGGSGIVITRELNKASGVWNLKTHYLKLRESTVTWPKVLLSYNLDYLVVAGGGSGTSGAGGAGGYRASGYGPSPLRGSALSFTNQTSGATFPVTIGAGAAAGANSGNDSTFSPAVNTITSAGGGQGSPADGTGKNGGSGGGGRVYPPEGAVVAAGAGNTPPTDPPQGNPGGTITVPFSIGPQGGATIAFAGGGGATAAGANVTLATNFTAASGSFNGGAGAPNTILGPDTSYAGGGGGFSQLGASFVAGGAGGAGGGGTTTANGTDCGGAAGTANTGGGAGGNYSCGGFAGGSGIVVVRGPSDRTFAVTPCTNTISTHPGGDKIAKFTVSGVLTVT
tara:strand:+ start:192 stop:1973 length:1782 start_codon:yes stop_codon:yes gene_type:complete